MASFHVEPALADGAQVVCIPNIHAESFSVEYDLTFDREGTNCYLVVSKIKDNSEVCRIPVSDQLEAILHNIPIAKYKKKRRTLLITLPAGVLRADAVAAKTGAIDPATGCPALEALPSNSGAPPDLMSNALDGPNDRQQGHARMLQRGRESACKPASPEQSPDDAPASHDSRPAPPSGALDRAELATDDAADKASADASAAASEVPSTCAAEPAGKVDESAGQAAPSPAADDTLAAARAEVAEALADVTADVSPARSSPDNEVSPAAFLSAEDDSRDSVALDDDPELKEQRVVVDDAAEQLEVPQEGSVSETAGEAAAPEDAPSEVADSGQAAVADNVASQPVDEAAETPADAAKRKAAQNRKKKERRRAKKKEAAAAGEEAGLGAGDAPAEAPLTQHADSGGSAVDRAERGDDAAELPNEPAAVDDAMEARATQARKAASSATQSRFTISTEDAMSLPASPKHAPLSEPACLVTFEPVPSHHGATASSGSNAQAEPYLPLHGPVLRCGEAKQFAKGKGADRTVMAKFSITHNAAPQSPVTVHAFAVFDGHGGKAASAHAARSFLEELATQLRRFVPAVLPPGVGEKLVAEDADVWKVQEVLTQAMPAALTACFENLDKAIKTKVKTNAGTTATVVTVVGWNVIVAAVGDSCAYLDIGKSVVQVSHDHRLDTNEQERKRLEAAGVALFREEFDDDPDMPVGPLRVRDGNVAMSRALGDADCPDAVLGTPEITQIVFPITGGRIIVASDGLWDAINHKTVAFNTRSYAALAAANKALALGIKHGRLTDDISVVFIDALPALEQQLDGRGAPPTLDKEFDPQATLGLPPPGSVQVFTGDGPAAWRAGLEGEVAACRKAAFECWAASAPDACDHESASTEFNSAASDLGDRSVVAEERAGTSTGTGAPAGAEGAKVGGLYQDALLLAQLRVDPCQLSTASQQPREESERSKRRGRDRKKNGIAAPPPTKDAPANDSVPDKPEAPAKSSRHAQSKATAAPAGTEPAAAAALEGESTKGGKRVAAKSKESRSGQPKATPESSANAAKAAPAKQGDKAQPVKGIATQESAATSSAAAASSGPKTARGARSQAQAQTETPAAALAPSPSNPASSRPSRQRNVGPATESSRNAPHDSMAAAAAAAAAAATAATAAAPSSSAAPPPESKAAPVSLESKAHTSSVASVGELPDVLAAQAAAMAALRTPRGAAMGSSRSASKAAPNRSPQRPAGASQAQQPPQGATTSNAAAQTAADEAAGGAGRGKRGRRDRAREKNGTHDPLAAATAPQQSAVKPTESVESSRTAKRRERSKAAPAGEHAAAPVNDKPTQPAEQPEQGAPGATGKRRNRRGRGGASAEAGAPAQAADAGAGRNGSAQQAAPVDIATPASAPQAAAPAPEPIRPSPLLSPLLPRGTNWADEIPDSEPDSMAPTMPPVNDGSSALPSVAHPFGGPDHADHNGRYQSDAPGNGYTHHHAYGHHEPHDSWVKRDGRQHHARHQHAHRAEQASYGRHASSDAPPFVNAGDFSERNSYRHAFPSQPQNSVDAPRWVHHPQPPFAAPEHRYPPQREDQVPHQHHPGRRAGDAGRHGGAPELPSLYGHDSGAHAGPAHTDAGGAFSALFGAPAPEAQPHSHYPHEPAAQHGAYDAAPQLQNGGDGLRSEEWQFSQQPHVALSSAEFGMGFAGEETPVPHHHARGQGGSLHQQRSHGGGRGRGRQYGASHHASADNAHRSSEQQGHRSGGGGPRQEAGNNSDRTHGSSRRGSRRSRGRGQP